MKDFKVSFAGLKADIDSCETKWQNGELTAVHIQMYLPFHLKLEHQSYFLMLL